MKNKNWKKYYLDNFDNDIEDQDSNDEPKRIMEIVNDNEESEFVEVILYFRFKDNGHEIIIYTKNETDADNNVTVYINRVRRSESGSALIGMDDDEFERVQEVINELSKPSEIVSDMKSPYIS